MSNLEIDNWNIRKRVWDSFYSLPHGGSIEEEDTRLTLSTQAELTIDKKVGKEWVKQETPTRIHDYIVQLPSGRRIRLNHS